MDVHPTSFPGNKAPFVKSKYKKTSEAPKQTHRRTFGTIRNPNVQEKTVPQKPKPSNQISVKQAKTEPLIAPVQKTESAKKTPRTGSNERENLRKKKTVSFHEASGKKKSPVTEVDGGVRTPVRPPFSVKPVRIPGTPYLSAEKCSSCQFDRLQTASYWLGQIKSAEAVGKHFVSAAFFRLANDCKAEPARNLQIELKKYATRHDDLTNKTEWEGVFRMYGIIKKECEIKGMVNLFDEEGGSKVDDDVQEQRVEDQNDEVKEIHELKT